MSRFQAATSISPLPLALLLRRRPTSLNMSFKFATTDRSRGEKKEESTPLIQYILVRRDLITVHKWSMGSLMAQAVHAGVAAVWASQQSESTIRYCEHVNAANDGQERPQMHTIVLEAKGEEDIIEVGQKLKQDEIGFQMWKEQPENTITALASFPSSKSEVQQYFKPFKLFR